MEELYSSKESIVVEVKVVKIWKQSVFLEVSWKKGGVEIGRSGEKVLEAGDFLKLGEMVMQTSFH